MVGIRSTLTGKMCLWIAPLRRARSAAELSQFSNNVVRIHQYPPIADPFSAPTIAGMTSADTSAAHFDTTPAEEPRRWSVRRWLAPVAVALALLSAFLTFLVLTGLTRIEPTPEVVRTFYLINAATILLLVGIIIRELWQLILARRRGRAAARLHVQIVSLFSIVAVLPAVLVAIVANVTISRGLDRLFSGPTKEVIQNSLTIARAYMQDHAQLIRGDIIGMANDIAHARPLYDQDRRSFREMLTASAASRNLPGAMIIDKNTNILESADTGMRLAYSPPAPDFLSNVNESEPEIAVLPDASFVAAVIRLRAFNDTFLYVARPLDPNVVNQLKQTEVSVAEYAQIESRRLGIQVAFALMFAVIALTILMASVLIGLNFANSLVSPIRRLMNAAQTVSTGDLHVQVSVHQSEGDLAQLGETFNKMTQELRSQRDELVNASDLIDSRRRFIEAVLSSASAGIIGVDASGSVGILNRSAEKLIGHSEAETLGHPLSDVLPELDDMMKTAREGTQRLVQGQITINRDGQERNLSVRVSAEKNQPHDSQTRANNSAGTARRWPSQPIAQPNSHRPSRRSNGKVKKPAISSAPNTMPRTALLWRRILWERADHQMIGTWISVHNDSRWMMLKLPRLDVRSKKVSSAVSNIASTQIVPIRR